MSFCAGPILLNGFYPRQPASARKRSLARRNGPTTSPSRTLIAITWSGTTRISTIPIKRWTHFHTLTKLLDWKWPRNPSSRCIISKNTHPIVQSLRCALIVQIISLRRVSYIQATILCSDTRVPVSSRGSIQRSRFPNHLPEQGS